MVVTAGSCGNNQIVEEKEYNFTGNKKFQSRAFKSNYFIGLGGAPQDKWLSISPITVPLRAQNKIESFYPSKELPALVDYYVSPPSMRTNLVE